MRFPAAPPVGIAISTVEGGVAIVYVASVVEGFRVVDGVGGLSWE